MKKQLVMLVIAATVLIGCTPASSVSVPYTTPTTEGAETKLTEAASSATHSLQNLAKIQQAEHPEAKLVPPPDPNAYGMGETASIDWYGPIGPLVTRIAHATQYKLRVLGAEPAIPVLVSISATDTPLGDILRDAGYQAKDKAQIIVFPSTRVIELRYAKS